MWDPHIPEAPGIGGCVETGPACWSDLASWISFLWRFLWGSGAGRDRTPSAGGVPMLPCPATGVTVFHVPLLNYEIGACM
jgi:hypothetical protein